MEGGSDGFEGSDGGNVVVFADPGKKFVVQTILGPCAIVVQ